MIDWNGTHTEPTVHRHTIPGPPPSIRVGPFVYSVRADKDRLHEIERQHDLDGDSIRGYTFPDRLEIVLDPLLAPAKVRDVLWHELAHAVINLTETEDEQFLGEEAWIRRTSTATLAMLRDNPDLVAYLTAED